MFENSWRPLAFRFNQQNQVVLMKRLCADKSRSFEPKLIFTDAVNHKFTQTFKSKMLRNNFQLEYAMTASKVLSFYSQKNESFNQDNNLKKD